jgi:hypothetical protein
MERLFYSLKGSILVDGIAVFIAKVATLRINNRAFYGKYPFICME